MRLLLVTNDYPPRAGGIQQYLANLTDAIDGDVLVLAPSAGPADETRKGENIVRRHHRRFLWPTPSVRRWVVAEARAFRPDLVLFGAPYPLAWMSKRVGREAGTSVGVLCHGAEVTVPAVLPVARQLLRRSLRGADHRFAVSRYTVRRVERISGKAATYVGSGVDPSTFHPDLDGTSPEEPPVVGCVSRFVPRKGQHRLIRAAAELQRRGKRVRLLLVGSGRKLDSLRRLADALDVDARFEVSVPWRNLPGLYREMDVFCMPCRSRWAGLEIEGLGIVYLEAAASGLPVLAGDSGGAPETVRPGTTGFVVHDVSDIVEGIDLLLSDPERASAMGAAGRAFVTSEYRWDKVVERIEAAVRAAP